MDFPWPLREGTQNCPLKNDHWLLFSCRWKMLRFRILCAGMLQTNQQNPCFIMLPVVLAFIQFCIIKGKYEMVAINLPCTPKRHCYLHSKYSIIRSHFINIRCDQRDEKLLSKMGTTYNNVWSIIKVVPRYYPHTPKGHVTFISFVLSFSLNSISLIWFLMITL